MPPKGDDWICKLGKLLHIREKFDKILHVVSPAEKQVLKKNIQGMDDKIYKEFVAHLEEAKDEPYKKCPDGKSVRCAMCPYKDPLNKLVVDPDNA